MSGIALLLHCVLFFFQLIEDLNVPDYLKGMRLKNYTKKCKNLKLFFLMKKKTFRTGQGKKNH